MSDKGLFSPLAFVAAIGAMAEALSAAKQGLASAQAAFEEAPSIRLIDGRRMQCKDIPNGVFLDAVRRTPGTSAMNWRNRWEVHATLEEVTGWIPENLLLAKARKLIAAGKMGGCPCGCRGDWHPADECNAYNCCHPE